MLLAGDIGGTKTKLALFDATCGTHAPLVKATYPSARYPSLEAVVRDFLLETGAQVDRASFGVAGPVVAGRATITNLPWIIDTALLRTDLGLSSVHLINDLVAVAYAVPQLEPADLHTLNPADPTPGGAIAVVAPGTGLGEAFLTWDGARYLAHPSEGGHVDFAPTNELEIGLLRYLQTRFEHVSYERICSGIGMPNIYHYLRDSGIAEEPAWLAQELAATVDPTPVIATAALDTTRPCNLCAATLRTFVSILGTEAGNLALKVLATGGVYLGGGIPPRILPALEEPCFMEAFLRKGRFANLLRQMPVRVILNSEAALLGAACHGFEMGR
ncbi:MAG: glucokinase [Anaerolineae bacterium]|nr:glucokinase [Anaerolineae bacterium]